MCVCAHQLFFLKLKCWYFAQIHATCCPKNWDSTSETGEFNGREKKQTNARVMEPGNHVWFDVKGVFLHCQGILQNLTKSGMSPPLFHP